MSGTNPYINWSFYNYDHVRRQQMKLGREELWRWALYNSFKSAAPQGPLEPIHHDPAIPPTRDTRDHS